MKEIVSVGKNIEEWFPQIEYDLLQSMEELYFVWWLCDLKDMGYVEDAWYEDDTFVLGDGCTKFYTKHMKTKSKRLEETVVRPTVYTPDFKIKFTEKADGVFYRDIVSEDKLMKGSKRLFFFGEDLVSYVEIKPDFDFNNMTRYAKIKINWLFQRSKIYVNLVKVPTVFKDTFTPERYLLTDNNRRTRSIKYKVKTLKDFI